MQSGQISLGQIVCSKAGRDRNRYFVVVGIINNDYVLISDGDLRKIEKPKRKKVKHLIINNILAPDLKEKLEMNSKVNNGDIKNSLKPLGLTNQSNCKEV